MIKTQTQHNRNIEKLTLKKLMPIFKKLRASSVRALILHLAALQAPTLFLAVQGRAGSQHGHLVTPSRWLKTPPSPPLPFEVCRVGAFLLGPFYLFFEEDGPLQEGPPLGCLAAPQAPLLTQEASPPRPRDLHGEETEPYINIYEPWRPNANTRQHNTTQHTTQQHKAT